jgi:hypothetical protein
MPKKLPSSGYIQFGKQLDLFEEAAIAVGKLGTLDPAAPTHITAAVKLANEREKVVKLFDKKGK